MYSKNFCSNHSLWFSIWVFTTESYRLKHFSQHGIWLFCQFLLLLNILTWRLLRLPNDWLRYGNFKIDFLITRSVSAKWPPFWSMDKWLCCLPTRGLPAFRARGSPYLAEGPSFWGGAFVICWILVRLSRLFETFFRKGAALILALSDALLRIFYIKKRIWIIMSKLVIS